MAQRRQERPEPDTPALRGDMRREVEEAGFAPPIGVVTKEMTRGFTRGVLIGGAVGLVLGILISLIPMLGTAHMAIAPRILIGALCGIAFGAAFGFVAGGGLRSQVSEQDRELPVERSRET
jgi:hypothetical protein